MTFKKILCPIDFSNGSQRAMHVAVQLANQSNAELVLVHAWYIPPVMYSGEYVYPSNVLGDLIADAKQGLDQAVREAKELGASQVSATYVTGAPWAEIAALLERESFDLCVMGTHGRTGVARVFLGSVAEKLVRHAPCSVMTVRPDAEVRPFTHVLCPTDFSESAAFAAELAGKLVGADGVLDLLHVIEVPVAYSGRIRTDDLARDLDRRSAAALENEVARLQRAVRVPIRMRTRMGYPGAQTLAELDADPTIDLVATGSHGRTGIKRVVLGSVAEKIVRHASCPVLVARKHGRH